MTGEVARAAAAAIEDVLTEWGMWLHQPPERKRRAVELLEDGATPDALREVCEFVERQVKHDLDLLGKRLSVQLARGLWRDTFRAAQAARARAPEPSDTKETAERNRSDPEPPSAKQLAQQRAGMAYCRLKHDHHPAHEVMRDVGARSMGELRALAIEGAAMYGATDPETAVASIFEPAKRRARR